MPRPKGRVSVVWGGNRTLARAVGKKLEEHGFDAHVGGQETSRSVYDGIIRELRRASWAIILVQWPTERALEQVAGEPASAIHSDQKIHANDDCDHRFRPNLMFEWGFLDCRLRDPDRIQEFLIGISRKDLPTDLQGLRDVQEIELRSPGEMADTIVAHFLQSLRPVEVEPFDVLKDWQHWKKWVQRQRSGDEAPDNLRLAKVLLHSIQPAFYLGELDSLSDLLKAIGEIEPNRISEEVADARRIVQGACEYYKLSERQRSGADYPWREMQRRLAEPAQANSDPVFYWLEAIRLNFLGRSHYELHRTAQQEQQKLRHLGDATKELEQSLELFKKLSKGGGPDHPLILWHGYVLRNLGLAYEANQGRDQTEASDKADEYFAQALRLRKDAYAALSQDVNVVISDQILVETVLVELDLMRRRGQSKAGDFNEIVSLLQQKSPKCKLAGVWKQALVEARDSGTLLGEVGAVEELNALLDRLVN